MVVKYSTLVNVLLLSSSAYCETLFCQSTVIKPTYSSDSQPFYTKYHLRKIPMSPSTTTLKLINSRPAQSYLAGGIFNAFLDYYFCSIPKQIMLLLWQNSNQHSWYSNVIKLLKSSINYRCAVMLISTWLDRLFQVIAWSEELPEVIRISFHFCLIFLLFWVTPDSSVYHQRGAQVPPVVLVPQVGNHCSSKRLIPA